VYSTEFKAGAAVTQPSYASLTIRTVVVHTVTYFVVGLLAFVLLRYDRLYAEPGLSAYMRATDDAWVMAGPMLQPVRGVLFASGFYVLREPLFNDRRGGLVMWWMLLVVGVLSTFGPSPSSLEGLVYTRVPVRTQMLGLPEALLQSLLMSVVLFVWVRHPGKRWLSWLLGALFVITMVLPTLGLLTREGRPN
jgi:hypothetical protein